MLAVLMNMRAESALPEEPFLETARFSHVRTPSIHGICTAQTHQLLAKIVAKSRRARLHEVRLLLLRYCPPNPKRQGHHPKTRSPRASPRAPPPCVSVQKWAPLCAPTPIGQHWWAHSGPFMLLGPPFIHYAWPRRYNSPAAHCTPTPLVTRPYTKPAPDHSPLPFPNFRTPAGVLGWEDVRPGFCCQVQPAKTACWCSRITRPTQHPHRW